ncbi:acyltransferase [Macrococcus hajekii]|uniref:Acyltransferase n=1 Tax=Macrococcus hajekii TaxID=198482 RepID=A0A4R6BND2_9STAP|nr:acyltransferase family protein [Macrococcus hajekii]TDM03369.1 acyltransferase [Macrococcus hajekii]GGA98287.1 acyltransferase [Macrococcus hajekii]
MKNKKILEIESLRIIVALLVAIYHIWVHKVSGGVDVFFVITGFLITKSLLSSIEKNNEIHPFQFVIRILKRLYPHIFILVCFVTLTFPFIVRNFSPFNYVLGVLSSLTYSKNWELISQYNEYIGTIDDSSIFKHLWATSIQGQFYVIWALLFVLVLKSSKKLNINLKILLSVAFVIIFLSSFVISVVMTRNSQSIAYYHTFTRLFEFSAGGLLYLYFYRINISKTLSSIFSFIGMFIILSMGLLLNIENNFPGYIALIPTIGVALVLISTRSTELSVINKLLTNQVITKISFLSYPFYLWHWVIYVYAVLLLNKQNFNLIEGLFIISIAILLAYISSLVVRSIGKNKRKVILGLMALIMAISTLIGLSFSNHNDSNSNLELNHKIPVSKYLKSEQYPGATDYLVQQTSLEKVEPSMETVKQDIGTLYKDNCNQVARKDEVISCSYGPQDAQTKVALVGGSHTVQWFDPIKIIAEERNFNLVTYTKLDCRFTAEKLKDQSCVKWNENVMKQLVEDNIDIVITNGDINSKDYPGIPKGYLQHFADLEEKNTKVIAFRDTPWLKADTLNCLKRANKNIDECYSEKNEVLSSVDKWTLLDKKPPNVDYIDFTPILCPEDKCQIIQGNVLMYWDTHHLTATYTKSMTPYIDEAILKTLSKI